MEKSDLKVSEMLEMSYRLWNKNKETWSPMEPQYARNMFLWMIEELGEAIAIVKKKGEDKIMNDNIVREALVEELCDVLMYFSDVLNRYKITPYEFSNAYYAKFNKNMKRDYNKEHNDYINAK